MPFPQVDDVAMADSVKKLNDAGVFHYWQLAAMTPEESAKLDADLRFNGRIERDKWSEQARTLMTAE